MRPQSTPPRVPRRTTMLELVQSLARGGASEAEIVATVLDLVESGRAILIGTFRGVPLRLPEEEARPSGGLQAGSGKARGEREDEPLAKTGPAE